MEDICGRKITMELVNMVEIDQIVPCTPTTTSETVDI